MLAGAVLEHSELHFIAFGAFASCGTVAAMWASILGRHGPRRTAAGT
jgi:hypothetical protein